MPLAAPRTVTLDGRDYRHHRDCGEFVWLAALDAGIAGPFYWVRATEMPRGDDRAARLKSAQSRLSSVSNEHGPNGPEYMAALGELHAAMREGP